MHSLQISRMSLRHHPTLRPDLQGAAVTVRAGCPICQGPLLLAACLGLNPAGPAQHIYRCAACDHLEWFEQRAGEKGVH